MNGFKKTTLIVGDLAVAVVSFFLMLVLGFGFFFSELTFAEHAQPFLVVYALWFLILYLFNFYDHASMRPTLSRGRIIGITISLCFLVAVVVFYAMPWFRITPKTNLVIALGSFAILFLLWRRLYFKLFSESFFEQVVVVGERSGIDDLINALISDDYLGYRYRGVYQNVADVPRSIDTIVWNNNGPFTRKDVEWLSQNNMRLIPTSEMYEEILLKTPLEYIDERWFVERVHSNRQVVYDAFSRLIDIAVSFSVIIVTSPLWIIMALAIYLEDRGPVFYYHERMGRGQKSFVLRKFRSMSVNGQENRSAWATSDDPSVTRVGRIIRKLHIDELPQFINVLIGDMTLVGPRPEYVGLAHEYARSIPYYYLRHTVKPGFTGWAQIKYRPSRSVEEARTKFEYDLYYIKNRNLFLDFGIVLKTIQIIFTH